MLATNGIITKVPHCFYIDMLTLPIINPKK